MESRLPDYIELYWGKAGGEAESPGFHPAAYHMLDVAAVVQALLDHRPALTHRFRDIAEGLPGLLPLVAALHDLGKVTRHFQALRPDLLETLWGEDPGDLSPLRHGDAALLLWEDDEGLGDLLERRTGWAAPLLTEVLVPSFGHHGWPPRRIRDLEPSDILRHGRSEDVLALVEDLCNLLSPKGGTPSPPSLEDARAGGWLVAGLVILADWVGSNRDWFPYHAPTLSLADYWCTLARPQAERAIAKAGLVSATPARYPGFAGLTGIQTPPSPLQSLCESLPLGEKPRLIVIEDLTGSGKTEAALILAARLMASGQAERLYVGLPTQATSNAMFGRLGALYRRLFHEDTRPTIALAHGGAWLHEGFREAILAGGQGEDDRQGSSEGEEPASRLANAWLADNRKKALLADLGVGTLDQALLGAMGTRHQALRLFGTVGSVLVVDEVHAYDTYTHRLLVALLTFQAALGGSAILLSATLPIARRRDLLATYAGLRREALSRQSLEKASAYPLLTLAGVGEDPIQCPVEIPPGSGRSFPRCHRLEDEEAAVAVLVEAADRGDCAVWIRNTVQDARASFDLLADRLPPERLSLFHARFLPADRARLEEAVLASFGKTSSSDVRRGRILVATQVVEQSLDLDFDVMVSDLAPMDLMIQRAGRLHRHRHRPTRPAPVLHILGPAADQAVTQAWYATPFPRAAYVYPVSARLWLTQWLLTGGGVPSGGWVLPRDARAMVEGVYGPDVEETVPEALRDSLMDEEGTALAHGGLARSVCLRPGDPFDAEGEAWTEDIVARTRLGEETRPLVLARLVADVAHPLAETGGGDAPPFARRRAWAESEVAVPLRLLDAPPPPSPETAAPLAVVRDTMGWSADRPWIAVLKPDGDAWIGEGRKEGRPVVVRYDRRRGLSLG